ncbi:hypothetical protein HCN44_002990 [Aphidius gifuensis]|uniref:Small ribosomal subunit protein mS26 n=1 Tax=Aphidius gifuensis TaxID=684658 RepID=A0A835CRP5_APHGI|nr:uncharacterized protein LOC122854160 [Aphidius gifuensis]KAF7991428.1 hypothetical protein HCN44_002990 [Aphidius gifuensis]
MLRSSIGVGSKLTGQIGANEFVGLNNVYSQTIRWRKRKPMRLGTAKTKLFRVPPRIRLPEEESIEILRLSNNYRTYMKSIKAHMVKIVAANEVQFDEALMDQLEQEDYEKCMKLNDEWNEKVRISREKRHKELMDKRIEHALIKMKEKEEKKLNIMKNIEEQVRKMKIEAKTFITADNIDQAIEEALQNVVSYNSVIDLQGKIYEGVYTPEPRKTRRSQPTE